MTKAKELFIQHVSGLFEGDVLAAKSILLNLTSHLTHRLPIPLGSLPINIYNTSPETIAKIVSFLRSILPATVVQEVSIKGLNAQRIYPKSDGEKLCAGRGQFVSRTALIIDESKMQEGKLQDMGMCHKGTKNDVRRTEFEIPCWHSTKSEIII